MSRSAPDPKPAAGDSSEQSNAGGRPSGGDGAPPAGEQVFAQVIDPKWLRPDQAHGLWRTEIALRIRDLWHRLREARALATAHDAALGEVSDEVQVVTVPTGSGVSGIVYGLQAAGHARNPAWASHMDAARLALSVADGAIRVPSGHPSRVWAMVVEWCFGTKVTAAWESVHDAEAELVEVSSDADVNSALPSLWSWMQQAMTRAEWSSYKDKMEAMISGNEAVDRNLVRKAYQDVIRANNDLHTRMRSFRNTLLVVSVGLGALLLAIALWHALDPHFLSFCTGSGSSEKCPGGHGPLRTTAFEIEIVGALGGMLAGAFLIGQFRQAPGRYDLLPVQLVLKPVAGAATAVVAVLLLQSGLIVRSAESSASTELLLGYAALFGFSQQLLTRIVDKRASTIIESQEEGRHEEAEPKK